MSPNLFLLEAPCGSILVNDHLPYCILGGRLRVVRLYTLFPILAYYN